MKNFLIFYEPADDSRQTAMAAAKLCVPNRLLIPASRSHTLLAEIPKRAGRSLRLTPCAASARACSCRRQFSAKR
jgi:hypothetical protein